ncbi:hypothetical protein K440DRAFT_635985 [Wilcoxina mikolae CBS 423.85]|nr:hypothetical protein K440DRAFT_635985 [Wilcoxina mikolae CBS 423.85]
MADSLGLPSSQWHAGGLETLHVSSNFAPIAATHNILDVHDAHYAHNVSLRDRIDKMESIRFSNSFTTSVTVGFQSAEYRTDEYITKRQQIIVDCLESLSDQAFNWIRATVEDQLEMIDADLSESLESAEKLANIGDLNESLAANVKDFETVESVQGPNKELVAAHQEIEELEEEVRIEMRRFAKLERQLEKCKSDPDSMDQKSLVKEKSA